MNAESELDVEKSAFRALAVFLLLVVIVAAGLWALFARFERETKIEVTRDLAETGRIRTNQLSQFLRERRGNAEVASVLLSERLLHAWWQGDQEPPAAVGRALNLMLARYGYIGAMILDPTGEIRFRTGRSVGMSATGKAFALRALAQPGRAFSEIYFADPAAPQEFMLDTFSAMPGMGAAKAAGVVVLREDWDHFFSSGSRVGRLASRLRW